MTQVTAAQAEARARTMAGLPERDRNVLIALGVMQREVIDARSRFDRDYISVTLTSETVFEGVFFPGDCG